MYEGYGISAPIPFKKILEVLVLSKGGIYELYSVAEGGGKVKSKLLGGLEVDLKEVFV